MPWRKKNVLDQKILFVARAIEPAINFSELCREFGVSRPTGYKWVARYREKERFKDLEERSRRPKKSPNKTGPELEARVLQLRDTWSEGGEKIWKLLQNEGWRISLRTVNRILKRNGRIVPQIGHRGAPRRFEREQANQLWQLDFKGEYRVSDGYCFPLSILDDHSRFTVGLYALRGTALEPVKNCLAQTFTRYGVPEAMLMDHGTPWWNNKNVRGLSRLSVWLINHGVRLHFSGVRHPQTQGKVERFHRTLKRAIGHRGNPRIFRDWQPLLDEYRTYYNFTRPHQALQLDTPSSRYTSSDRDYSLKPDPWRYPDRLHRRQVNDAGLISWGQQFFVSEALAGQTVGVEEVDGKLLVCFRHMYIREINLTSRRTLALLEDIPVD